MKSNPLYNMLTIGHPGQIPTHSFNFTRKLMVPALVATSVGMYWQYSQIMTQKTKMQSVQKVIARLPLNIKNLTDFSQLEITAITRRNTIKNKLIGRLARGKGASQVKFGKDSSQLGFEVGALPESQKTGEASILKLKDAEMTSSLRSTSSVATDSSESALGSSKLGGILKSGLKKSKAMKNVTFAL